jgi:hypothetical protein
MINVVKIISSAVASGRRIVTALRSGKTDVVEATQAVAFGDDGNAPEGMRAIYLQSEKKAGVIVGYLNSNAIAEIGGKRIFSTNSQGVEQIAIYLRANGSIEIGGNADFAAGFTELKAGFDQLKSDFNSLITAYNSHVHPFVGVGPGNPGTTTTTLATGTPSTASIDDSKKDNIKLP